MLLFLGWQLVKFTWSGFSKHQQRKDKSLSSHLMQLCPIFEKQIEEVFYKRESESNKGEQI